MSNISIKVKATKFKHLNGAHFPLIIIDDEVDLISAPYFLNRYNNGRALATLVREAKSIRKFYVFCFANNIDIIKRFSALARLTAGEVEMLHAFISCNEKTGELVAQTTFQHYFSTIARFIDYIFTFYQSRVTEEGKLQASRIALEGMKKAFEINNKSPHNGKTKERVGLNFELQAKFFAAIAPYPENSLTPFKNEKVRWRNFCLFLTLILAGNRKGESLGLRVRDFYLSGNSRADKYFEIVKRDRTLDGYGKKEIPQVKTDGRIVSLADELVEIFEYYVTKIRPQFKNAQKSEYMFLSIRDGNPLSVNAPNESIKALIKLYPEFKGHLCPHILRNTFHDILSTALDEKFEDMGPMRKQQIKTTLQEYAGGWAAGSNMVAHYPKGSIQRRVAELHMKLQSNIMGIGKEDEE